MTPLILALIILLVTVGLFISDWFRLDLVAMMMLLALMLTGLVTPQEGLAGFSDPVVIMIAALFVVGGAILHTGTAHSMGQMVSRLTGNNETAILISLMLAVALLSGFMSSTGTTAVFLPIAVTLARQAKISPGRFLMPMAFAALLGGMLTLIGTPPNLVVANTLKEAGLESFKFFDFTLPGLAALAIALIYILLPGRLLLPPDKKKFKAKDGGKGQTEELSLKAQDLLSNYALDQNLAWLRLPPGSNVFGKPLAELNTPLHHGVQILCTRDHHRIREDEFNFCRGDSQLEPHQEILILGSKAKIELFARETGGVFIRSEHNQYQLGNQYLGLAEILLLPRSKILGKTLTEFRFRDRYRLHVLAIQRNGKLITDDIASFRLRFGDFLLVQGPWNRIARLNLERRDFTVLNLPEEAETSHHKPYKIGLTMGWMGFMLLCLLTGWLPVVTAILATAVGLVLTRCLSMEEAYRSISWESVILIAAMLPMSTALSNTGGTEALSSWLASTLGSFGPYSIMATLFVLTSGCSLFMSNTATTVLIAPVALQLALGLGYSPQTFLMVVALAASSAFATPISSPVNTMVLAPGGYKFKDYVKLGLPLQLLMLAVTLLVVPRIFAL